MAARFDPTSLARFGRLSFLARNVVEGFLSGVHQSPYKGFSVEFAEHRQYYPGDEIRHIDWRAFGKTDRYYIKEHEEETNLQAHLLLDASGSMAYQGRTASKFDYAVQVAASLAYLMLHQRDAVGLAVHDHQLRGMLPPKSHPKHLPRILQMLEATQPGGETSLAPLWHRVATQIRRRGLIVILSDCFDQLSSLRHALRHLSHRRHEILLFQIVAPEELDFPFTGRTQFRNLENVANVQLLDAPAIRAEYQKNIEAFCTELRRDASRMRIDYQLLRTDQPVERALGHYLNHRRQHA